MTSEVKIKSVHGSIWEEDLLPEKIDTVQAALEEVNLDWEVVPKKLAYLVKGEKGKPDIARSVDGWIAHVNNRTHEVVTVSRDNAYTHDFAPNAKVFEFVDELIDVGCKPVAAGTFTSPARSWLAVQIGSPTPVGGDLVQPHVVITNNHEERSVVAYMAPVRLISQSFMSWNLPTNRKLIYLKDDPDNSGLVLSEAVDYLRELQELGGSLATVEFGEDQIEEVLDELFPLDESVGPRARHYREEARLRITNTMKFSDSKGNSPDTAWAALCALAEFEDWYRTHLRVSRIQRSLDDTRGEKQRVLSIMMDKAQI